MLDLPTLPQTEQHQEWRDWGNRLTAALRQYQEPLNNLNFRLDTLESFGLVTPQMFGAKQDGWTNDISAFQKAVNHIQARNAGKIYVPGGLAGYGLDGTIQIEAEVDIFGDGHGTGPGTASTVRGSKLHHGTPAAHLFRVNTDQPVKIHDLLLKNITTGAGPTAGSAVYVESPANNNANSRFYNLGIIGCYDGITFKEAGFWRVRDCFFSEWRHRAITNENAHNNDAGDNVIEGNTFFGPPEMGNTVECGVYIVNAPGLAIGHNKFLGANYGVRIVYSGNPTGTVIINNNSFEEYTVKGIEMSRAGGATNRFGHVIVTSNEFLRVTTGTPQNHISIVDSGNWLFDVVLAHNVFNNGEVPSFGMMDLKAGEGMIVAFNQFSASSGVGIQTGGSASKVRCFGNNAFGGMQLYGSMVSADQVGEAIHGRVVFTGSTGAVLGGFNILSVTRLGAGHYRVNFNRPFPNTNYSAVPGISHHSAVTRKVSVQVENYLTTSVDIICWNTDTGAAFDPDRVSLMLSAAVD